jgi:hypothetical protein
MLVAKRRARRKFVSFYIAKDDRVSQAPRLADDLPLAVVIHDPVAQAPGFAELFAAGPVFLGRA